MIDLKGKSIFVTAAANGIGRAIAQAAADCGASVLATDISEDGLADLSGEGLRTERLDATDAVAVKAMLSANPAFDGIVNAVGIVHHGTLETCSPDDWKRSFEINVDTMYNVLHTAVPMMVEAGGGSVVNIASAASSLKGFPFRFAYGASKAAVIGLTKSIAADYVKQGIRCNAICPGTIDSPSLQQRIHELGETVGGYEVAHKAFVDRQPMGRLGTVDEVAALAIFLLSDASAFTTGQVHVIDGGILA